MNKAPEYYRGLPWTRRVRLEENRPGETYFVAYIEELPTVEAAGDSWVEAFHHLQAALDDYIEAAIDFDTEIPEPRSWMESLGIEPGDDPGKATVKAIEQIGVGPARPPKWMPDLELRSESQQPVTAGT